MARFASSVKVDWSVSSDQLLSYAGEVAESFNEVMGYRERVEKGQDSDDFQSQDSPAGLLGIEESKLLIKNSISPRPMAIRH